MKQGEGENWERHMGDLSEGLRPFGERIGYGGGKLGESDGKAGK